MTSKRMVTTYELARLLGCSPEWIRRKARHRAIPALRIGPEWRFNVEEVKAALELPRNGRDNSRLDNE